MPCYDGRDKDTDYAYARESEQQSKKYMELLCSACRVLESYDYDVGKNPLLDEWWDKHKGDDAEKDIARFNKLWSVRSKRPDGVTLTTGKLNININNGEVSILPSNI